MNDFLSTITQTTLQHPHERIVDFCLKEIADLRLLSCSIGSRMILTLLFALIILYLQRVTPIIEIDSNLAQF
jgi:hypothetical protein